MKTEIFLIIGGALALLFGAPLLAVGLFIVALVLLIGQLPTSCTGNCNQGHACTCQPQFNGDSNGR